MIVLGENSFCLGKKNTTNVKICHFFKEKLRITEGFYSYFPMKKQQNHQTPLQRDKSEQRHSPSKTGCPRVANTFKQHHTQTHTHTYTDTISGQFLIAMALNLLQQVNIIKVRKLYQTRYISLNGVFMMPDTVSLHFVSGEQGPVGMAHSEKTKKYPLLSPEYLE